MIVKAIKTDKILPEQKSIFDVLDSSLAVIKEGSVIAITSKIVSLCEGRVTPIKGTDKEELLRKEADYYLPANFSQYGYHFSIKNHTLTALAGIDESNSADQYVLWPKNPQDTANKVRGYLKGKFNLKNLGVVITDSTSMPMRWGTVGVAIGYSGFKALHNYVGEPDLFGRPFKVSQGGIANGLANTAVLVMGEGTEQTPIVLMEDLAFVQFQDADPSNEELQHFYIKNKDEDLYAPFFNQIEWQRGEGSSND